MRTQKGLAKALDNLVWAIRLDGPGSANERRAAAETEDHLVALLVEQALSQDDAIRAARAIIKALRSGERT